MVATALYPKCLAMTGHGCLYSFDGCTPEHWQRTKRSTWASGKPTSNIQLFHFWKYHDVQYPWYTCMYICIYTYSFQPRHMAYMHHDVHLSFCHMFTSFEIALQPVASEIGSSQNTFTRSFNKLHPGKRTSSSLRPRNQAQVDAILDSTLLTSSMIHGPFLGENHGNHGNHGSYHGCQTSKFGTFGEIWHLRFFSSKPWLSQNHPMLCTRPQVPPQLGPATFLERSLVSPRCMVIPPYNVRKAITRHSYFDGVYIYMFIYVYIPSKKIYHP